MSDLEQVGGEAAVRDLIARFVQRMADDFIIGFRFEGKDLERIAHHEGELAIAHLAHAGGAPTGTASHYTGRSLPEVHLPLRISKGQFDRRLALLATVLMESAVPEAVIDRWIAHDRRLESALATPTLCTPPAD